jgi:hypothetical protein
MSLIGADKGTAYVDLFNTTTGSFDSASVSTLVLTNIPNSLLKTLNSNVVAAVANTDYQLPISSGTGINIASNVVSNTGVLSLAGTANQIIASASTGAITLSLPQSIATTSSPTFAGLNIGSINGVLKATAGSIGTGATTSDLTEGTNLYFTNARAIAALGLGSLSGILRTTAGIVYGGSTTSDLPEGTNLYFTNARAISAVGLAATLPLSVVGSTFSLGYNTTNLRLTSNQLNTIQDISTVSSPTFLTANISNQYLKFGTLANGSVVLTNNITTVGANLRNVIVGKAANNSITGSRNVILGIDTGGSLTSGSYNILIGDLCGNTITTGNNNILIGPNAVASGNPSGNVQVGISTCSGSNCTSIGFNANQGTSGNNNTALGYGAGNSQSTGTDNVFIGLNSGFGVGTHINNYSTVIGSAACRNLGTSNNNTCIGYAAGYGLSTGGNNTIIGTQAGLTGLTATGNVFLGYQAGLNESGNDKLYIANSSTATPLIAGNFSTPSITINGSLTGTSSANFNSASIVGTATCSSLFVGSYLPNVLFGINFSLTSNLGFNCVGAYYNPTLATTSLNSDMFSQYIASTHNCPSGYTGNIYCCYIDTPSKTGVGAPSNSYGLYVKAPTIGTNKIGIYTESIKVNNTQLVKGMASGYTPSQASAGNYFVSFGFTFANVPRVVATSDYAGISYNISVMITSVSTTGFNLTILNGPGSRFEHFSGAYWIAICN